MLDNPLLESGYQRKMKRIFVGGFTVFVITFVVVATLMYFSFENQMKLQEEISKLGEGDVILEEIVPFEWELLYSFDPYVTVEEMEKMTGFSSTYFREASSESMTQYYFVKENQVVCAVVGYFEQVGFQIIFEESVLRYGERAEFSVEKGESGLVLLKEK